MAWLRLASPLLLLLLGTPVAAQSALGTSSLGGSTPALPQPVPPGGAHVLRAPPGMVPQRPAPAAAAVTTPPAATPPATTPPATPRVRPVQSQSPAPTPRPAQQRPAAEPRRQQQPATPPAASKNTPATPPRAPASAPTQAAPQTPVKQRPRSGGTAAAAGAAAAGAAAGAAAAAGTATEATPPASPAPTQRELESPNVGSVTGLPLPRFVSLRSDEVNLRIGPDTRFPIEWTYQRRDLPVQILREYNHWRRIRDMDGTEGWVHQSTLAGRRTFLTLGPQEHILRQSEGDASGIVARLMPGVVGRIRSCRASSAWCEVQVGDHRGYLKRSEIWGVGENEDVN